MYGRSISQARPLTNEGRVFNPASPALHHRRLTKRPHCAHQCGPTKDLAPAGRKAIIATRSENTGPGADPERFRGCSSVVEHLLAKEDVASSSLVTRSSRRHTPLPPSAPDLQLR